MKCGLICKFLDLIICVLWAAPISVASLIGGMWLSVSAQARVRLTH